MLEDAGSFFRQAARETLDLPAEFVVADAHQEQVRFSSVSPAIQPHIAPGTASDVSAGGMSLRCRLFLPRMCEGTVRIYAPGETSGDDATRGEPIFEQTVKVRRTRLIDQEPTYALGLAFVDTGDDIERRVKALIQFAAEAPEATNRGEPSGA